MAFIIIMDLGVIIRMISVIQSLPDGGESLGDEEVILMLAPGAIGAASILAVFLAVKSFYKLYREFRAAAIDIAAAKKFDVFGVIDTDKGFGGKFFGVGRLNDADKKKHLQEINHPLKEYPDLLDVVDISTGSEQESLSQTIRKSQEYRLVLPTMPGICQEVWERIRLLVAARPIPDYEFEKRIREAFSQGLSYSTADIFMPEATGRYGQYAEEPEESVGDEWEKGASSKGAGAGTPGAVAQLTPSGGKFMMDLSAAMDKAMRESGMASEKFGKPPTGAASSFALDKMLEGLDIDRLTAEQKRALIEKIVKRFIGRARHRKGLSGEWELRSLDADERRALANEFKEIYNTVLRQYASEDGEPRGQAFQFPERLSSLENYLDNYIQPVDIAGHEYQIDNQWIAVGGLFITELYPIEEGVSILGGKIFYDLSAIDGETIEINIRYLERLPSMNDEIFNKLLAVWISGVMEGSGVQRAVLNIGSSEMLTPATRGFFEEHLKASVETSGEGGTRLTLTNSISVEELGCKLGEGKSVITSQRDSVEAPLVDAEDNSLETILMDMGAVADPGKLVLKGEDSPREFEFQVRYSINADVAGIPIYFIDDLYGEAAKEIEGDHPAFHIKGKGIFILLSALADQSNDLISELWMIAGNPVTLRQWVLARAFDLGWTTDEELKKTVIRAVSKALINHELHHFKRDADVNAEPVFEEEASFLAPVLFSDDWGVQIALLLMNDAKSDPHGPALEKIFSELANGISGSQPGNMNHEDYSAREMIVAAPSLRTVRQELNRIYLKCPAALSDPIKKRSLWRAFRGEGGVGPATSPIDAVIPVQAAPTAAPAIGTSVSPGGTSPVTSSVDIITNRCTDLIGEVYINQEGRLSPVTDIVLRVEGKKIFITGRDGSSLFDKKGQRIEFLEFAALVRERTKKEMLDRISGRLAGLSQTEAAIVRGVVDHLRSQAVYYLMPNKHGIRSLSAGANVFLDSKLISDIGLFHAGAEDYLSLPGSPPIPDGLSAHEYLRGAETKVRLSTLQPFRLGLQDRVFGVQENNKFSNDINDRGGAQYSVILFDDLVLKRTRNDGALIIADDGQLYQSDARSFAKFYSNARKRLGNLLVPFVITQEFDIIQERVDLSAEAYLDDLSRSYRSGKDREVVAEKIRIFTRKYLRLMKQIAERGGFPAGDIAKLSSLVIYKRADGDYDIKIADAGFFYNYSIQTSIRREMALRCMTDYRDTMEELFGADLANDFVDASGIESISMTEGGVERRYFNGMSNVKLVNNIRLDYDNPAGEEFYEAWRAAFPAGMIAADPFDEIQIITAGSYGTVRRYIDLMSGAVPVEIKPLSRNGRQYGNFNMATNTISIDIASAKEAFAGIVGGLDNVKITGFVHAHEIFHALVKHKNIALDKTPIMVGGVATDPEERLADIFAMKVMGLSPPADGEAYFASTITDKDIMKQSSTPYASDSGEFLLNLHGIGIDIMNIEQADLSKPTAVVAGVSPAGTSPNASVPECLVPECLVPECLG